MTDAFWKRLSLIAGMFVLLSTFCLLAFVANVEIKDLDLWLHLGVGRHIVQNGFQIPNVDFLSCTIAGKPWVNHEWLFQVIVHYIHTLFGPDGLILMQVILVSFTTLILVFLGYNKDKQLSSVFILLITTLIYHSRFTIRPDLYSLLFFAIYIYILAFYLGKKWSLYVLFFIQIIWSNMHGFFFFGPLFVLIGLFSEFLKRKVKMPYEWNNIGRLTDDEYRRLKYILGAVVVACLFNPLTFKGAWYPLGVFFHLSGESNQIFFEKIIELKRPISWATLFDYKYPYYKLMIVLSFCSIIFNRRKLDINILIFWAIFLLFSLAAVRNLVFFGFAGYLVFVTNMLTVSWEDIVPIEITDEKFIHLSSIIIKILLVVWIIQYGAGISLNGYFNFDTFERKSEFGGVSLRQYPDKAVKFLVDNDVKGNFFNDFNSGAYLVGNCSPNIKVFIDGRTEVYGSDFFRYYQDIWEKGNSERFGNALDKYNITGVLLNTVQHPSPEAPLDFLVESKEWIPVYFNYDAIVYLKDIPFNKEVIDKYAIDFNKYEAIKLDLYKLGSKNVKPYQHINRAYSLESMGYHDAAVAELEEALDISPNYQPPYKILGKIYAQNKEFQKAFEKFRIATILAPGDRRTRLNLALSYYDLGQYKYAIEQYDKIIQSWPNRPETYYFLSRTYIKDKNYDKGLRILGKAYELNPHSINDILQIGDMLAKDESYENAKKVYELALNSKDDSYKIYFKIGLVNMKLDNKEEAKEALLKALELDPDNKDIKKNLKKLGVKNFE
ncbi:MAG: tetratricopeptide repeat protein [Spirochaetes bacterium]|nr:tetratricopeptide repeat protein [Spirochaetota bacterium]